MCKWEGVKGAGLCGSQVMLRADVGENTQAVSHKAEQRCVARGSVLDAEHEQYGGDNVEQDHAQRVGEIFFAEPF